jgi:ribosomal protein S18 acetylase RimI-like enzyme
MSSSRMSRGDVTNFRCGNAPWEDKIARFLRSGQAWEQHRSGLTRTLLYCADGGDGGVIGFATVARTVKGYPSWRGKRKLPCLIVAWLAIGRENQGKGHGAAMLEELTLLALNETVEALYLLVDERNTRAIAFYRRYGFESYIDAEPWTDPDDGSRNLRMILPLF